MATMISSLPKELTEEILSRVPLKSTRAVRLTCKKWTDLFNNEIFTKMHIAKSATTREGESMMITMVNDNLYLMSVVVDHVDPSIELKGELSCLEEQVKISNVFQCEGLLLCILENDTRIVVWNPYLGQTRWIEPRYSSHCPNGLDRFSYALGYKDNNDNSCRSIKLLRFVDYYNYYQEPLIWYEIYDFDSDLWTTLDITNPHWSIMRPHHGLSLKGNTYWCARERNPNYDDIVITHMICFDFTRERFGPLLSLPLTVLHGENFGSVSCVREDKLACLVQCYDTQELDIWITTKIEPEEVSWSKFLKVETKLDIKVPYIGLHFFIDEEKKVVIGFDDKNHHMVNIIGEAGYFRQLEVQEHAYPKCWSSLYSYVPSLVQIKQSEEGERKQQSDLETRRHDENMRRLRTLYER